MDYHQKAFSISMAVLMSHPVHLKIKIGNFRTYGNIGYSEDVGLVHLYEFRTGYVSGLKVLRREQFGVKHQLT